MITFRSIFSILLLAAVLCNGCNSGPSKKELSDRIKVKLHTFNHPDSVHTGERIHNPLIISEIYSNENGEHLLGEWDNKKKVDQMISVIQNIETHGLNPYDYHLESIEELADKIFAGNEAELEDMANLHLQLTDAFLLIASHLAIGKIHPQTIDPQWNASRRIAAFNLVNFVDSILKHDITVKGLQSLTPTHREYRNLKKALVKYRTFQINGGWENFSTDLPKIAKGTTHPDVAELRKRLSITQGDVYGEVKDHNFFDQILHNQVMLFQKRNGLTADGVVSKTTIDALNIPVAERIATIEANLERWRWLSDDLGQRHIKVNIANYELQVIENDTAVLTSAAIVGRPYRKTPVFSSNMNYLVLAPTWTVPPTILRQDIIPAVRKNPSYLAQKNMKVYNKDGSQVNPATINWGNVTSKGFPYRIVQAPGKENALGSVKFMFPNNYSVYIHDTPTRELFTSTDRSFSSGCIRISKPLELAAYLLQDKPEWSQQQITQVISRGKEHRVNISNPIPVHILYLTAWADDEGTVYFRKDIYERDPPLLNALKQTPPVNKPALSPAEPS